MRHHFKMASPDVASFLKKNFEPLFSPLILSMPYSTFLNSISALIADFVLYYGVDVFSNFDQILITLVSSPEHLQTALSLTNELFRSEQNLTPAIIPILTQYLFSPLSNEVLMTCSYLAQRFPQDVKQFIVQPLFEKIGELPKIICVSLIRVVTEILRQEQNQGQQVDSNLIGFLIQCVNDPDVEKSIPAAFYFEKNELPFIQELVVILYRNLHVDEEIDKNGISSQSLLTLKHICSLHQEQLIAFLVPQIQQDIQQMTEESARRSLRAISAINEYVPDFNSICSSLFEMLKNPSNCRKEVISCMFSLAQCHSEIMAPVVQAMFPLIYDSDESLRMQSLRYLILLMQDIEIPCEPFIESVAQLINSPNPDEMYIILEFCTAFFQSVNSLDGFLDQALPIIAAACQIFIQSSETDILITQSLLVIANSISKLPSPEALNLVCSDEVLRKALQCLTFAQNDESLCQCALIFFNNLFNTNTQHPFIPNFVTPQLTSLLTSNSSMVLMYSWAFTSDLLRKAPNLFEPLLPSVLNAINELENFTEPNSETLGNIALVLYDLFKVPQIANTIPKDVCQRLLDAFCTSVKHIEDCDIFDLNNISLAILRLCAMHPAKMEVRPECFGQAARVCGELEEEHLVEESGQLAAMYLASHPEVAQLFAAQ